VSGDILSVYPLDGNWASLRHEYWWRALAAVSLPPAPTVLLIGLGGGTQLHLLHARTLPSAVTVIERDPAILTAALDWFGLRAFGGVEYLVGDVERVVPWLASVGRRFDFIMEDAVYAEPPARARALARALTPLVAPGGALVVNRHRRAGVDGLTAALRPFFTEVRVRRVRREGENVLVCCRSPLSRAAGA
jgi:spermidine synthase